MNKKTSTDMKTPPQMTASLMKTLVLTLAILGMITVTAHAGAFLTTTGIVQNEKYSTIVVNRSTTPDSWSDFGYLAADYTGFYIGTFQENNDSKIGLLELIKHFLDDQSIKLLGYAKHDLPGKFETDEEHYNLKVTVKPAEGETLSDTKSGTWTVTSNGSEDVNKINFYSVKGATEYALYYVDPAKSSGVWTTRHLRNKGDEVPALSHLSVVKISDSSTGSTAPIPEPATMMLFGFGLIGLAGMARRRNSRF